MCFLLSLHQLQCACNPCHLASIFLKYYVCLLSCLYILIVMYVLFCIFCFHRANWHSPATLTEVFPCFFLSCKANARVCLSETGHGPHSSKNFCVSACIVCFVSFCVLFVCKYVLYCTAATGWQPNCSLTNIYHF